MASYRELLPAGEVRDRRDRRDRGARAARVRDAPALRRRPRARRVGGGAHPRRRPHPARLPRVAGREAASPTATGAIVVYCAGGTRSAFAAKTLEELGYANVVSLAGGFTDWKRNGFPTELPRSLAPDAAHALQPPPADPGGRRGGPAEAARLAHAPDRRRRARLARVALPRRGRRRHARHRRRRRRRRVEPPAPDRPLDRAPRRAEGRVGEADDRGAQPRRDGQDLPGAAHVRERRPHPRRGLGRDRRRRRQLPDALPR